ncbi:hypothetical protein GMD78_13585 [Ornithinibacillus sp. L9]|uniref:Uncharacterized protein n=1 Tax=Ornithinibacillus caprae TaxID=2678566 RepID=A0A6N8FIV2_9BACI|nr:hypothetical protein [Ornithinibacillus caprae]MUK89395.1 hypothetical protein [Ornithinibacillus caprae]
MIAILPIVIIVLILLFSIFLNYRVKILSGQKAQWLLFGYFIILVVSFGIYLFIPKGAPPSSEEQYKGPDLYLNAMEGNVSNIDSKYVERTWEFPMEEPELNVELDYIISDGPPVFVEEADIDSLEVILYKTPTIINGGIDITDRIPNASVQLTGSNKLQLYNPNPIEIEYSGYVPEFTLTQFKQGVSNSLRITGTFISFGDQILYIRVPQHIEVNTDSLEGIQFVGKENED